MNVEDRAAITDVLHRYAVLLDDGRYAEFDRVFAPDARFDAMGTVVDGVGAIGEFVAGALAAFVAVQHQISTVLVDPDGADPDGADPDTAHASCALHAVHVHDPALGVEPWVVGGRYTDRVVRTGDGWRIRHRTLTATGQPGSPATG